VKFYEKLRVKSDKKQAFVSWQFLVTGV